jgi:hypothetical protein
MPIIEKAVQYVVKKTLDLTSTVLKAIRKGDFSIVEDFFQQSAEAFFKVFGCCAITGIVMFGFTTLVIVSVLSAITPVDPTRMSVIEDSISGPPSGPPLPCPPGECITVSAVGCFNFNDSWNSGGGPQALPIVESAANYLASRGGNFVNRMCSGGDVEVYWRESATNCGQVLGPDAIAFGNGSCWAYISANQGRFHHLFAHEIGHAYNRRFGFGGITSAQAADCGHTLSTYRGTSAYECSYNHSSVDEDFAETVGNYIYLLRDCPDIPNDWNTFWNVPGAHNGNCANAYSGHLEFAESSFLFGP